MPRAVTIIASVTMKGCSRPPTMIRPLSAPNSNPTQGATMRTPSTPNFVSTCGRRNQSVRAHSRMPTTAGKTTPRILSRCGMRWSVTPFADLAKLANRKRVVATPISSATRPTAGMPMRAAGVAPGIVSSIAVTTEQIAISEPTERSMPPVMMTAVMPVAMRPVVETCLSTSSRLP